MADVCFVVRAPTRNKLFSESVRAFGLYAAGNRRLRPAIKKKISVRGSDSLSTLYRFLEELIYLFDAKQFLALEGTFVAGEHSVRGTCVGVSTKGRRFLAVKSPTYADMYLEQKGNSWKARVVLDV